MCRVGEYGSLELFYSISHWKAKHGSAHASTHSTWKSSATIWRHTNAELDGTQVAFYQRL